MTDKVATNEEFQVDLDPTVANNIQESLGEAEAQTEPSPEPAAPVSPVTEETIQRVFEMASKDDVLAQVIHSVGLVMQSYGWLGMMLQQKLQDPILVESAFAMVRQIVVGQTGMKFEDKQLVYHLRHTLLPLFEQQTKINDQVQKINKTKYEEARKDFLKGKPPVPFADLALKDGNDDPVVFLGEEANVRKVLEYAADEMAGKGYNVVFFAGADDLSEMKDKKYPVIPYAQSAHFLRNNSLYTKYKERVCLGADVVIVENIPGAIRKSGDEELQPDLCQQQYKKLLKWAKEGKTFIIGGMSIDEYDVLFAKMRGQFIENLPAVS